MTKQIFTTFTIGIFLLVAYIVQFIFDLKWEWLYNLQLNELYKRWSGVSVLIFIIFQWALTITRVSKRLRKYALKFTSWHKWIGAFSPLLFYFHAMEFGFAYLALLSYLFFANMLLGVVNLDIIKSQKEWVFQSWMIAHVAFSVIISFISIFHIGVVFYYK